MFHRGYCGWTFSSRFKHRNLNPPKTSVRIFNNSETLNSSWFHVIFEIYWTIVRKTPSSDKVAAFIASYRWLGTTTNPQFLFQQMRNIYSLRAAINFHCKWLDHFMLIATLLRKLELNEIVWSEMPIKGLQTFTLTEREPHRNWDTKYLVNTWWSPEKAFSLFRNLVQMISLLKPPKTLKTIRNLYCRKFNEL